MEEKKKKWETRYRGYFLKAVEVAKKRLAEENISFDEIERNTGVEAEFSRILFDDATGAANNISKIFGFLRIRLSAYRSVNFKTYYISEKNGRLRVRRKLQPKCSMFYDPMKDVFYRFSYVAPTMAPGDKYTDIIKNEMRDAIFEHIENKREEKYIK